MRPARLAPGGASLLRDEESSMRHARIGDDLVAYRLRRSRRRTIGFAIDVGGLSITAPHRVPLVEIDRAIADKQRWIARKLVEWREHARRRERAAVRWAQGGTLTLLGEPLSLAIRPGARVHVEREGGTLHVRIAGAVDSGAADPEALRHAVHAWLKIQARGVFGERLAEFTRRHGIAPAHWSLSSARTRWGSCSAAGAVRLNWRLVQFPLSIVDYVIAHELAHLQELNHGPRFWARVSELCPDWQAARRWLRHHPDDITMA